MDIEILNNVKIINIQHHLIIKNKIIGHKNLIILKMLNNGYLKKNLK